MANRWIITAHRFHEHETLAAAETELKRLTAATGKKFRIYRIKRSVEPDEGETQHGEQG